MIIFVSEKESEQSAEILKLQAELKSATEMLSNVYNLTMHALMDVHNAYACRYRLRDICTTLENHSQQRENDMKDVIQISTPQFDRTDGAVISTANEVDWNNLKSCSKGQLLAAGCQVWNETLVGTHWLFPKEWYHLIPEGFEILCIDGETEKFKPGVTDDDTRFGVLAYGFLVERP